MTDPLFTPLKSHPSTWQAEVAQIKVKLVEAESAVEWADVRATQAVEEARELRAENTELALQVRQAAQAHEARLIAEDQAKALRERVAVLELALECIACRHVTVDPLWWQLMARAALQEGKG